jgi:hypothetical protein
MFTVIRLGVWVPEWRIRVLMFPNQFGCLFLRGIKDFLLLF